MPDTVFDPTAQQSVEMPNGVIGTGVGGDVDAQREQFEERHEQRTGQSVEATIADAHGQTVEPATKEPRGRKRFAQLTAEREAEKARADAAEARSRELEARLHTSTQPSTQAEQTPAKPAAVETSTRPEPQESEIGVKYQSLSEYIKDLNAWGIEQNNAKIRAEFDTRLKDSIEADRASRTLASQVDTVFTRGREQFPDFDAVLKTADSFVFTPQQRDAILSMDHPEQVMYALSKDHAALKDLLGTQNPIQLGVKLAQLIPRTEAVAPLASTPVAVRTTNAPAPPQPVGAGSRTAQPSLAELAATGNYEAYKARREAERKAG